MKAYSINMRVLALSLAVLFLAYFPGSAGLGQSAMAGVFNPETFRLANGMQVVVIPNHRAPVVTHMVWYKVGSADEPPGKSGIAHLLEHLMFKGTKTLKPGEFSAILARNGGQENAFTSYDYTSYFQSVAVDRLELVMRLEADRMTNLVLTEKDVNTEKLVIMEERRQRTDNNPRSILGEQVNAAFFLNYPYRKPVIGWRREIRGLTLNDAISFYRKWYAPNNATLVVAGDITASQLRPLAEKYYGKIPARKVPARIRPQEPPHRADIKVLLRDKRVRQPIWSRSYMAPSYITGKTEYADALDVLSEILGGGATTRLYRDLVVKRKLAVSVGISYNPGGIGPTDFTFSASPKPGVSVDTLKQAIDGEIAKLLKSGITADELARAKQSMQDSAIYARDSIQTGARELGAALSTGRSVEDVESWPQRINKVSLEEVNRAARAILYNRHSLSALLLPEGTK